VGFEKKFKKIKKSINTPKLTFFLDVREKYFLEVLYYIFLASNTGNLPPWEEVQGKASKQQQKLAFAFGKL